MNKKCGGFEIFFKDLNKNTQKRLIEFVDASALEMNWDTIPVAVIPPLWATAGKRQ